jgi:hypothetical protein
MSNMPTIEVAGPSLATSCCTCRCRSTDGSALREPLQLDHLEARTFPSGTMIHTYRPHEVNR